MTIKNACMFQKTPWPSQHGLMKVGMPKGFLKPFQVVPPPHKGKRPPSPPGGAPEPSGEGDRFWTPFWLSPNRFSYSGNPFFGPPVSDHFSEQIISCGRVFGNPNCGSPGLPRGGGYGRRHSQETSHTCFATISRSAFVRVFKVFEDTLSAMEVL